MDPCIVRCLVVALICTLLVGCRKHGQGASSESVPEFEPSPTSILLLRDEADRYRKQIAAEKANLEKAKAALAAEMAAFEREKAGIAGEKAKAAITVEKAAIALEKAAGALEKTVDRTRIEKTQGPAIAPRADAMERPLHVTCEEPVRAIRGRSVLVGFRISGRRTGSWDGFKARSLHEGVYDDAAALRWEGGSAGCASWVYHQVAASADCFHLRLHVGSKLKHSRYDLLIEHEGSGGSWRIPVEVMNPPNENSRPRQEPNGQVVLETLVPLLPGVTAFVDVDGQERVRWPNDQTTLMLTVKAGTHEVVVRSKYQGNYYRKAFSISVPAAGTTQLYLGKVDRDPGGKW